MSNDYDVAVIGGGIHGVGVAQAAAAAGQRVLVLEKTALAAGTSHCSSKLIHGGLRYLESAQFALVRESLRERAILLRIAPELVRRVPFFIPVYRDTRRRPWQLRLGLSLYALLGNLDPITRFRSLPRADWGKLDGLRGDGLETVLRYYDAQTDDSALTRAVMRSARELGAELACPAELIAARREPDGYNIEYQADGTTRHARAATLVNAAGPWVNAVQMRIEGASPGLPIDLVQGAHILLDYRTEQGVYYVEAPQDRRAVFIMPWQGRTLVGTTETPHQGAPDAMAPHQHEIDYLGAVAAHYFPALASTPSAAFAGLRVLPRASGAAFHRRRETLLLPDDPCRPRLVSIYGGKLTGYRATAARVIRLLTRALPARPARADTAQLRLRPE